MKCTAVPRSSILSVIVSEGFEQFGCHEDVFVFLFKFDELVAEVYHGFFVCYNEFVVCFAYAEELIVIGGVVVAVEAVPDWDASLGEVFGYVYDFVEVFL